MEGINSLHDPYRQADLKALYLRFIIKLEDHGMLSLEDLKQEADLVDEIDWDLGPEEAVKLYLEWGNTDWGSGKNVIRSASDYSTYFVVNCWRKPFYIYLIRRNSKEAIELAQFELPSQFEKDVCELKGVYGLDQDLKAWLKRELGIDK
jgi:hypothetical protein